MIATKRDYYDVLGISRDSDEEEVRRAFRTLARSLHPDVSDDSEANEKFIELAEAYEVLSKSNTRFLYDRFGYRGGGKFAEVESGPSALFDYLLGSTATRRANVGELRITEFQAERGTTRRLEYELEVACERCEGSGAAALGSTRTCPGCRGSGRIRQGSTLSGDRVLRIETCDECLGRGRLIIDACKACGGAGRQTERHRSQITVPAGARDGQSLEVDEGKPSPYVVVRVQAVPAASHLVRYAAAVALVVACVFLILLAQG
jgi:molecular chaperone DnaJ